MRKVEENWRHFTIYAPEPWWASLNPWHVKNQRIKTEVTLGKLGLRPLGIYMTRRRLRWVGHVSRMGNSRKPKKNFDFMGIPKEADGQATSEMGRFNSTRF